MLQACEICHRNLSSESVILRLQNMPSNQAKGDEGMAGNSYCCTLTQLGYALRVPQETGCIQIGQPQPLAGSNPQYVAPELWNGTICKGSTNDVSFDGYAADLWSAGVMLLAMLMGNDAIFSAPVPADPTFRRICMTPGGLKDYVATTRKKRKLATGSDTTTPISDEAIDLLQGMLRVDPKARLTLKDVQSHPWVRGNSSE